MKTLLDYCLIRKEEKGTTNSGIIIPEESKEDKFDRGEVLSVGPGRILPMNLKKGDRVLFYGGIEVEGKWIVKQDDILGVI